MAEDLTIRKGTKEEQYQSLLPQLKALLTGEDDLIANLANTAAALKEMRWAMDSAQGGEGFNYA